MVTDRFTVRRLRRRHFVVWDEQENQHCDGSFPQCIDARAVAVLLNKTVSDPWRDGRCYAEDIPRRPPLVRRCP